MVDAVLIAGPTASGKSAAALALAEALDGIVINADSMQVYREVRILSARPSDEDMARVPASALRPCRGPRALFGRPLSDRCHRRAGRGTRAVASADLRRRHRSILRGSDRRPGRYPHRSRRHPQNAHATRSMRLGVAGLHAELAQRDPQTAARLRPSDTQRVLRAYEVFEATGRPLACWQRAAGTPVLAGLRLARFVLDVPSASTA